MKKKPTIYLDLDGIKANLLKKLLALYNRSHGTNHEFGEIFTAKAIDGRGMETYLNDYLDRDNIFDDIEPVEGAVEGVRELMQLGTVYVASAPSRNPDSASAKMRWVMQHTPIHRRNLILIKHKELLRGDMWFEDWHENIQKIRAAHPDAFIGTIAYPYNEHVADLLTVRAESHLDTRAAWRTLVEAAGTWVENVYNQRPF